VGGGDEQLRALVGRAEQRDPDAWEALYRRAYPRLYAYARRRLPTRDAADDAVSETMMRAFEQIDRFRWRGAGFDAWLYGILRNVTYETLRTRSRTTPTADSDEQVAPDEDDPLARLIDDEQAQSVRSAFARLSNDDQELLELRVVGGLSADEVGVVVGKRPGAVRMAQSRALGRLREALEEVSGAY
jgi:RNA polymerase sigma-70 factor (ECF subfamily)